MDDDVRSLLDELSGYVREPVIVEGAKDEDALKAAGFENIIRLNKGGSLLDAVESLQHLDRVVILTDLDQEGKILRKKLLKLFGPYGIHETKRPREILAQLRLSHVEGLKSLLKDEEFNQTLD
ncbi:MAG: toprim domain-containing protein [Candidatus Altiarchaeota archaeon]